MKKSDLASHVATQAALSKAQAHSAVDAVFSAIGEALASGESVVIPGFGTFTPKARAARRRLGGEAEGMAATAEAVYPRCHRGPERRHPQLR